MNFQSWTDDGSLRAPVFLRLRDDIDPKSVRRERRRRAAEPAPASGSRDRRRAAPARQRARRAFTLAVGAHAIKLTQPRSRLLAGRPGAQAAGAHQARPAALLRAGVAVHPAAPRRPAAHDDPHARRHRRPALLPEALGAGAAGVRRDDHGVLRAQGREPRVPAVQQPADAAVARAVGHARIPRLAFARAGRAPMRGRRAPTTRSRSKRSKARC